ncbi:MAG: Uncharacterized protein G01um101418_343 [Parcubacteria group bacterium Gr01-1014_18]|nr:MAG: Uncharacterized protein Greene041636_281 [Parcubacteria group bacterium Greene0416_36]TSC81203.1 MAG: Uncharacterized protein G01um101418_343 [Parcubacteria group bacterium Gr01-1014_18]TSC99200.1 MAG: Uncharacterized protein Greene101420_345 [Parcubacteria group bacterium Greene1014_20]TSD07442.1 MAG: Uncharacterized protein Greene07142_141 [Parcubacteria group bacterium Greene0714_2]
MIFYLKNWLNYLFFRMKRYLISAFFALVAISMALLPVATKAELTVIVPQMNVPLPFIGPFSAPDEKGEVLQFAWIAEYIIGLYKIIIAISGFLAIIIILVAGFLWVSSMGNHSQIAQAHSMIQGALAGIVVIMSSYLLLSLINPALLKPGTLTISKALAKNTPFDDNGSKARIEETEAQFIRAFADCANKPNPELCRNIAREILVDTLIVMADEKKLPFPAGTIQVSKNAPQRVNDLLKANPTMTTKEAIDIAIKCQEYDMDMVYLRLNHLYNADETFNTTVNPNLYPHKSYREQSPHDAFVYVFQEAQKKGCY